MSTLGVVGEGAYSLPPKLTSFLTVLDLWTGEEINPGASTRSWVIIGHDSSSDDDAPYSTIGAFPLFEGCNLDADDRLVALVRDASFIFKGRFDDLAPGIVGELSHPVLRLKLDALNSCVPGSSFTHKATSSEINSKKVFITT
jgi:hypothetical protein